MSLSMLIEHQQIKRQHFIDKKFIRHLMSLNTFVRVLLLFIHRFRSSILSRQYLVYIRNSHTIHCESEQESLLSIGFEHYRFSR
jgi:hypothetical protein